MGAVFHLKRQLSQVCVSESCAAETRWSCCSHLPRVLRNQAKWRNGRRVNVEQGRGHRRPQERKKRTGEPAPVRQDLEGFRVKAQL